MIALMPDCELGVKLCPQCVVLSQPSFNIHLATVGVQLIAIIQIRELEKSYPETRRK